jgi:hypothetical protein
MDSSTIDSLVAFLIGDYFVAFFIIGLVAAQTDIPKRVREI